MRDFFDEARAYLDARGDDSLEQKTDLKLESLRPVFERKMPLLVSANSLAVIQSAVAFAVEQNVRLIIIGGYELEDHTWTTIQGLGHTGFYVFFFISVAINSCLGGFFIIPTLLLMVVHMRNFSKNMTTNELYS